jgi:hypothetical protein
LTRLRVRPDAIVVRQLDTMTGWAVSPGPGEVSTACSRKDWLAGSLGKECCPAGKAGRRIVSQYACFPGGLSGRGSGDFDDDTI